MKKNLGFVLVCLLPFCLQVKSSQYPTYFEKHPIEERPVDIIKDIIEERRIVKRDIVNILSAYEEERIQRREIYGEQELLADFLTRLEHELNEDRFFFVGEDYSRKDFIFGSQFLSAAWNTLTANYALFDQIEHNIIAVKKSTTVETTDRFRYRIKLNPELDLENKLRIRAKLTSNEEDILDDIQFRFSQDRIEMSKSYLLRGSRKDTNLRLIFMHDYFGNYGVRTELKFRW